MTDLGQLLVGHWKSMRLYEWPCLYAKSYLTSDFLRTGDQSDFLVLLFFIFPTEFEGFSWQSLLPLVWFVFGNLKKIINQQSIHLNLLFTSSMSEIKLLSSLRRFSSQVVFDTFSHSTAHGEPRNKIPIKSQTTQAKQPYSVLTHTTTITLQLPLHSFQQTSRKRKKKNPAPLNKY